jgi:hypothetical protein
VSKFSREARGPRRAVARRTIVERVLIICGAQRTERDYLASLKHLRRNSAVSIKLKTESKSPLEVVMTAIKLRQLTEDDYDEVWAVFDVDEFDVKDAIGLAARNGIRTAVSNPCFELWLLLHFQCRPPMSMTVESLSSC